jgi:hypothetical protein
MIRETIVQLSSPAQKVKIPKHGKLNQLIERKKRRILIPDHPVALIEAGSRLGALGLKYCTTWTIHTGLSLPVIR